MNVHAAEIAPTSEHQSKPSGVEFVREVADLAVGAGILVFALALLALPGHPSWHERSAT